MSYLVRSLLLTVITTLVLFSAKKHLIESRKTSTEVRSNLWSGYHCGTKTNENQAHQRTLPVKVIAERAEVLRRDPILIRLNVIYDESFGAQYPEAEKRDKVIRNLIYESQLIYERPEMAEHFKFRFIVTNIQQSSQKFDLKADLMLDEITLSLQAGVGMRFKDTDMNIFVMYRSFSTGPQARGLAGLTTANTFCNPNEEKHRLVMLSVNSLYASYTLAHEMAHTLGVNHDAFGNEKCFPQDECDPCTHIMGPTAIGQTVWSPCTIRQLVGYLTADPIYGCIYSKERLTGLTPYSDYFDFKGAKYSHRLPGQDMPIAEQCELYLYPKAESLLRTSGKNALHNGNYTDNCIDHICSIDKGFIKIGIGPAPTGSDCYEPRMKGDSTGRFLCRHSRCVPE